MNHQDGLAPAEARVPRRRHSWAVMTIYERFEQIVAAIPRMVIAVIIVVALVQLIRIVYLLPITQSLSPLSHETFQLVFGMIMTLLIALELKHSIIKVVVRHENIECAWVPPCNQECA
ncbi:phosphate-starvation-inducible PsiE family protein [Massilia sp. TWR1-2-2]|uniref:phosphate-starvation-inducible PsiE family protein n=1 Tax=Massilia sp. TWR1-2-2 TaxID=2804584 RepID=UPI003CEE7CB9